MPNQPQAADLIVYDVTQHFFGGFKLKTVLALYESIIPEKLQPYFALSRTHHGVLDMMSPIFAALLFTGGFPRADIIFVGLVTVFAGYTAIYALNDIVGFREDKTNISNISDASGSQDPDAVLMRHPLAQGAVTFQAAVVWALIWGIVAILGAFYLNPVCMIIFLAGAVLETVYVLLLKITWLRIIVTGFVKSAGPVAAVFAVDSSPDIGFVLLIFAFHFLWEAGGQNIPNDLADMDHDQAVNAKTLPIHFGRDKTCMLILGALIGAVAVIYPAFLFSSVRFGWPSYTALTVVCLALLLWPGIKLFMTKADTDAMSLFNKASYFPLSIVCIILLSLFIDFS